MRLLILLAMAAFFPAAAAQTGVRAAPSQLLGTWHGTSTCTDKVAAPACQDETVVYVFTLGSAAGIVHWTAYKIVHAQREPMGEMDLSYDTTDSCWTVEFTSPRVRSVWRLSADTTDPTKLTGTARLLPGNETIRRVSLRRE